MKRRGLTVIETLVALLISSFTVAIGTGLWRTLGSAGDRSTTAADGVAISWSGLRKHHLPSDALVDSTALEGTPFRFTFPSYCRTSTGWREACIVELRVLEAPDGRSLTVHEGDHHAMPIVESATDLRLIYLQTAEVGLHHWSAAWEPSRTSPNAVAAIVTGDTIVLVTKVLP